MPKHFQIWKFLKVRLNMCITGLVIWTNLCLCCLLFVRLKSIHCQEPNTAAVNPEQNWIKCVLLPLTVTQNANFEHFVFNCCFITNHPVRISSNGWILFAFYKMFLLLLLLQENMFSVWQEPSVCMERYGNEDWSVWGQARSGWSDHAFLEKHHLMIIIRG